MQKYTIGTVERVYSDLKPKELLDLLEKFGCATEDKYHIDWKVEKGICYDEDGFEEFSGSYILSVSTTMGLNSQKYSDWELCEMLECIDRWEKGL